MMFLRDEMCRMDLDADYFNIGYEAGTTFDELDVWFFGG